MKIRQIIEYITNRRIYKKLPFGNDPLADIQSKLPNYRMRIIFDVGANIGQSAESFKKIYPKSEIFCFEPVKSTFKLLKHNLMNYSNIHYEQLALGNENTKIEINISLNSDQNSINKIDTSTIEFKTELIQVDLLSKYCINHKIEHIDYLKIDTEGYDLEVLKGGESLLFENHIDFIEVEVGMNTTNELHVPYEIAKAFLEKFDYYLFGIYEQTHEWKTNEPILRRANALFISKKILNYNL